MDRLRSFLLTSTDPKYQQVNESQRLLVSAVILEYLIPLTDDPFVFGSTIIYFFYELTLINRKELFDLTFRALESHCSQVNLNSLFARVFTSLVEKVVYLQFGSKVGTNLNQSSNDDFTYMNLLELLLQRDVFM